MDIRDRPMTMHEEPAEAALAEYLLRRDRGQSVELTELFAAYPGCEAELREFVAQERAVHRAMAGVSPATAPAQNLTGRTLGDFRLVRELGRGGMGIVWEAEQLSLARKVAVKLLPAALCSDPRHRSRFQNEARILAQLEHPNIVNVIAVGEDSEAYFFAMQFVDGMTVENLIRIWSDSTQHSKAAESATVGALSDTIADDRNGSIDRRRTTHATRGLRRVRKAGGGIGPVFASRRKWPTDWYTPMRAGYCTATLSRPTFFSIKLAPLG